MRSTQANASRGRGRRTRNKGRAAAAAESDTLEKARREVEKYAAQHWDTKHRKMYEREQIERCKGVGKRRVQHAKRLADAIRRKEKQREVQQYVRDVEQGMQRENPIVKDRRLRRRMQFEKRRSTSLPKSSHVFSPGRGARFTKDGVLRINTK
uniref:Uncharacterized protein n=1 Tax=Lygus hesperus TaxID=30085 RepID=A0A0A9WT45_LYGHE